MEYINWRMYIPSCELWTRRSFLASKAATPDHPSVLPCRLPITIQLVNKEVEKSIVRLAAKSRACGIHVILTIQRPSADV